MSVDSPTGPELGIGTLPEPDVEQRTGPEPVAHGSRLMNVFNDVELDLDADGVDDREATTYDVAHRTWSAFPGDHTDEPYVVAKPDADDITGLPPARYDREYILEKTSSRWMAGTGDGDDYSAYYEYHLKLRERDEDGNTYSPPMSVSVDIQPQDAGLVHPDGNALETPYGEGSRVLCQTTWAESPAEIEARMLDVLGLAFGVDRDALELARDPESRRIMKAEAHVRFAIAKKAQVVETLEQSKELIAYGGDSKIDAHQKRQREGWLEAVVDAERWWLLGFPREDFDIEAKVYQASSWANKPESDPMHHPKLEASYGGARGDNAHPHADEWDRVMGTLRSVVSAHLDWSGVGRDDLVADDFQDGPGLDSYTYDHPTGRREQLRERYESVTTELYREATKASTSAVYDLLRAIAVDSGASYDTLEDRTGLARSTIRYHVRRLEDAGVVERIGNPVLVVFPSIQVLEDAEDVLRRIYPEDQLEDLEERAQQRRERREERDHPSSVDDDDQDGDADRDGDEDVDDLEDSDDGRDRDVGDADQDAEKWVAFDDSGLEPHQLANALERDYLEPDHVELRVDPYDWITG